jgi:hypothetical protein
MRVIKKATSVTAARRPASTGSTTKRNSERTIRGRNSRNARLNTALHQPARPAEAHEWRRKLPLGACETASSNFLSAHRQIEQPQHAAGSIRFARK